MFWRKKSQIVGQSSDALALKQKEERLQAMIDSAVDAIITIDAKGKIQDLNPAAEELLGYKEEEVQGKNVNVLVPEPLKSKHDGYLKNYLKTGEKKIIGIGREVEAQHKSGEIIPIHLSISEFQVGKDRYFTGILRDLSAQKRLIHRLEANEERYKAIFDMAVDAILTIDERGIIQTLNPAALKLFGYSLEQLRGENIKVLMPSPFRDEHDKYIRNYLRTGDKKIIGIGREVSAKHRLGSTFPIHLSVSEFRAAGNRYFAGIIHDMREKEETLD